MELLSTVTAPAGLEPNVTDVRPDLNINVLSICPLSTSIAIGFSDGRVYLLDAEGRHQRTLQSPGKAIWAMATWPDSDVLLSGGDHDIRVWDTAAHAGSELLHVLTGHQQTVRTLAMLDASAAVSGSLDGTLRVWNVSSGACIRTFEGHTDMILCMAVDGDRVVSGSRDGTARVWSVSTGSCLHELRDNSSTLYSMTVCHDKSWVAVGASDGGICVWDVASGALVVKLLGHQSLVSDVQENTRGQLVSADAVGMVRIWDLHTRQQVQGFAATEQGSLPSMKVTSDDAIVTGDSSGRIRMWKIENGAATPSMLFESADAGHTWSRGIAKAGKNFVTASVNYESGDNLIRTWRAV